jgi:hypothetical protein
MMRNSTQYSATFQDSFNIDRYEDTRRYIASYRLRCAGDENHPACVTDYKTVPRKCRVTKKLLGHCTS